MTTKKNTPSGAQRSMSARTKKQPASPGRPKREGKAAASDKLTAQQKAQAEQFKTEAVAYAKTAYDAALAHFEANHNNAFALSRLAVVYGETKPGDVHMVVTLPGVVNEAVDADEVREAVRDAELLARTLEHPDCSDAFKKAFGVIFTEHILDGSDITWTTPAVVRVMMPLVLLEQWRYHDGAGITPTDILVTLSSELAGEAVSDDVRAGLAGKERE